MSRFKLTKPCDNCPFLKRGGIRVHPDRAREIASYFTDAQGGSFSCHKTVDYSDDEDDALDGARTAGAREQICAGGMIFADKQGKANQIVRIMERLGAIDWATLRQSRARVFDTLTQMLKAQR